MNVQVSPVWLDRAWYGKTLLKKKPYCCIQNGQLKITVFRENGVGMRVLSCPVDTKDVCCFEVPDSLRAYCHLLLFAKDIRLTLTQLTLDVIVETPSTMIQYKIPNILLLEDVGVDPSDQDIDVEIGTEDWFRICGTIPQKGLLAVDCNLHKRMITVKHSKNKWGAVVMARSKALGTASFQCRAGVVRFCFKAVETLPAFGTLTFMKCGVLKWTAGFMQVYLAPHIE